MGGCQNHDPFFGYPKYEVPYYNRDPKRDHNFDNRPCDSPVQFTLMLFFGQPCKA